MSGRPYPRYKFTQQKWYSRKRTKKCFACGKAIPFGVKYWRLEAEYTQFRGDDEVYDYCLKCGDFLRDKVLVGPPVNGSPRR